MKKAAQGLDELPQVGRDVIAISVWIEKQVSQRLPDVNARDLAEAWRSCCTGRGSPRIIA